MSDDLEIKLRMIGKIFMNSEKIINYNGKIKSSGL